jgi:hypothetical protein
MKKSVLVSTWLLAGTLAMAGTPDYKILCDDLGTIPGWTASQCDGMKMSNPMMGGEMVTASKTYTKGDGVMQVSVVNGMQAMMMWGPYASGTQMENDEVLMKIETIDGMPVGINYDKKEHSGGIVVQLAPNAVLVGMFDHMDWKDALEALKKLDWKRLKSHF